MNFSMCCCGDAGAPPRRLLRRLGLGLALVACPSGDGAVLRSPPLGDFANPGGRHTKKRANLSSHGSSSGDLFVLDLEIVERLNALLLRSEKLSVRVLEEFYVALGSLHTGRFGLHG